MSGKDSVKRVADSLEKIVEVIQDPIAYYERIRKEYEEYLKETEVQIQAPAPLEQVKVEVTLSPQERQAILDATMKEIEEQMTELRSMFVDALSELPPSQLKKIGEHLKTGRKFKLRRRRDCLTLDFGKDDEEYWLHI